MLESTASNSYSNPKGVLKIRPGGMITTCDIIMLHSEVTQIAFRITHQKLLNPFRLAHLKFLSAFLAEIMDKRKPLNH